MKANIWNSFESFIKDNGDRVYLLWEYKRIFTPYEIEKKFTDETEYKSTTAKRCLIRECVQLGSGDYLLGFQVLSDRGDLDGDYSYIEYHKLSDIELSYSQELEKEFFDET